MNVQWDTHPALRRHFRLPPTCPPTPNSKFLSTHTFSSAHMVVKHQEISPQGFDQTTRGPHLAAQDWLQPGGGRENLKKIVFLSFHRMVDLSPSLLQKDPASLCLPNPPFLKNLLLDCEMFNQEFSFGSLQLFHSPIFFGKSFPEIKTWSANPQVLFLFEPENWVVIHRRPQYSPFSRVSTSNNKPPGQDLDKHMVHSICSNIAAASSITRYNKSDTSTLSLAPLAHTSW